MTRSIRYNYYRARELEGTYPGKASIGVWIISYCRTQFGWGMITGQSSDGIVDPIAAGEAVRPEFDVSAKSNRIHHYERIRNAKECRGVLRGQPNFFKAEKQRIPWESRGSLDIKAAFEYTQQFVNAPFGKITAPAPGTPIIGTHSVPILAVSEAQRSFVFANYHWGIDWGSEGLGEMPFEVFDRCMIESWSIDENKPVFPRGNRIVYDGWERVDAIKNALYGLEIYDPAVDERIAWCFAAIRDGILEVDEFYVRPALRRQGFGSRLGEMLKDLAVEKKVPLKVWISYPDAAPSNRPALASMLKKLGLGVRRSGVRWAAYTASQAEPTVVAFPFIRIPDAPADSLTANKRVRDIQTLRGTILKYEDPFDSATDEGDWGPDN